MDLQEELKKLRTEKEFFIGIDSDGCVFDTMEIKQKECFCPNFIRFFELQKVSKYARETWEFVNLYSKTRGVNRFLAVIETIRLLSGRREVHARKAVMPDIAPLVKWTGEESKLGNPALEAYTEKVRDPFMDTVLNWSKKVNADISGMVYGIPPFPFVRESLEKLVPMADTIVVSQTPLEALQREWEENGIDGFARMIAGQEYGTKTEHIALGAVGKYPADKILMVGDAPGDFKAAKINGVLFFPINPGHEEESWERFFREGLDAFFGGRFAGSYEEGLISEFERYLPEQPPWKQES